MEGGEGTVQGPWPGTPEQRAERLMTKVEADARGARG
jgi:hypothetical protein